MPHKDGKSEPETRTGTGSYTTPAKMLRYALPVADHLAPWISGFFRFTGVGTELILPNGRLDLLFSLDDEPIDPPRAEAEIPVRTALYGELRRSLIRPGSAEVDLFGVTLFPWAVEIITGIRACDLDGPVLPLQRVGRFDSEPVRSMLSDCTSDIERVRRMEDLLSGILPKPGETELSSYTQWMAIWTRRGRLPDGEAALDKMFQRQAGMTTSQLARLARFHALLQRLESGQKIAALARELGYYDQAHLTRECREFAGLPPRQLHVQLSQGTVFRRDFGAASAR
ncbi:MAG: helix-turn-helix domain-containing protein [Acidobacteria bacterium]|nr:helix-turn-helix domain-containing protein [Acidobacteriota bacterium]